MTILNKAGGDFVPYEVASLSFVSGTTLYVAAKVQLKGANDLTRLQESWTHV